jgi:hypothetical protein
VKFGFAWEDFTGSHAPQKIVATWGTAKDCCEIKSMTYCNAGDLLIPVSTLRAIEAKFGTSLAGSFSEAPVIRLRSGESLYRYEKIKPLRGPAKPKAAEA